MAQLVVAVVVAAAVVAVVVAAVVVVTVVVVAVVGFVVATVVAAPFEELALPRFAAVGRPAPLAVSGPPLAVWRKVLIKINLKIDIKKGHN